jgi:hypothetical protein
MRVCIRPLIIAVLAVGCTTSNTDALATDPQGLAEVRIDAGPLLAVGITRVTVDAAGQTQDLVQNPFTGTFDATLILPPGTLSIVASAFSGDTLVGRSQPTAVEVQAGIVTRVLLRILDLTSSAPPIFGPIFDSLSFPTTTQAGASATFALSVIAPVGDPITYSWTSDCQDATFSAPQAATTGWSKAAQGTCTITVVASSNGFNVTQQFVIAVFPAGSGSGAVTVNGEFVTTPSIALIMNGVGCFAASNFFGLNASCPGTVASPSTTGYELSVQTWGASSTPGTLDVSDTCGGRFGTSVHRADDLQGGWLPPAAGGICIVTARAVNGDGLVATLTVAILARPGTPATAQPPGIFASFGGGCGLGPSAMPPVCPAVQAGAHQAVAGNISWADGDPGSLTITDSCAGAQPVPDDAFFFFEGWVVPNEPGASCVTTIRATSLQGSTTEFAAQYLISAPMLTASNRDAPQRAN